MRWDRLFDDLDAQAEAAAAAELSGEVADRIRTEVARVAVEDRLRGSVGQWLELRVDGGHRVVGAVCEVGPGWLAVAAEHETSLVRTATIVDLVGLGVAVGAPFSELEQRLDVNYALRALARDRVAVRIGLADGRNVSGVIERVGADFIDLTAAATDRDDRKQRRTVRTSAVCVVRS